VAGFGPGDRERAFHRLEAFVIDQLVLRTTTRSKNSGGNGWTRRKKLSKELDELSNATLDCWVFLIVRSPTGDWWSTPAGRGQVHRSR